MSNEAKENCSKLAEEFNFFVNLVLDIRTRMTLFEAFEKYMIDKKVDPDFPKNNDFALMIEIGYSTKQLIELRKVFDNHDESYSFGFLIRHTTDATRAKHKKLFKKWKSNLGNIANKIFAHSEKDFDKKYIKRSEIDDFIKEVVELFEDITNTLMEKYSNISSSYLTAKDNDYLNEVSADVDDFFKTLQYS